MSNVLNSVNKVIILDREIIMLRHYLKRNNVIGQLYVLHIYVLLSVLTQI